MVRSVRDAVRRRLALTSGSQIFAYHFPSLRRVFGGTWMETAWKGLLLWFAYLAVIVATMMGVGMWSVRNEARP